MTLQAGPELDRVVAEAINRHCHVITGPEVSTDLNAAFAAAEKVGLFADPAVAVSCNEEGQWQIEKHIGLRDSETLAIQPTPALAICAAILKLKGIQCPSAPSIP